jgi:RpiB/LacA/LacB family sugar-phosphate isomerase
MREKGSAYTKERIVVSSDHAGYDLKVCLKPFIESLGYEVEDVGTFSKEPVDYPEYTAIAARKVISGECEKGIIFCGTGQGDAIAANKISGIRAALCWDEFTARMSRAHNNSNILVLGGWITATKLAQEIVNVWLSTEFDGGRHQRRIAQITEIENQMALRRGIIYDITQDIKPGMLLWPGDIPVSYNKTGDGDSDSTTNLTLCAHTGTHIDAPSHVLQDGKGTDSLELDYMLGMARVCCITNTKCIDHDALESLNLDGVSRLLLKTDNSALLGKPGFSEDYVSISEDAAAYLIEKKLKFVALDYLSVDPFDSLNYPVHKLLLSCGIVVAEGVDLRDVPPGDYEMLCLPLKLKNCDGAPARIILRTL